jgi:hypothetical protein
MTPHQAQLTRHAVAIMTAWMDDEGDSRFGIETVADILADRDDGDLFRAAVEVIGGFVNLTGLLMLHLYSETGQDENETLQLLAAEISSVA